MGVKSAIILLYVSQKLFQNVNCDPINRLKSNSANGIEAKSSTYLNFCSSNLNCGWSQVCVNFLCRCKPNYKYSYPTSSCVYSTCVWNSDCQSYDFHRICRSGYCSCDSNYYADSYNNVCKFSGASNYYADSNNKVYKFSGASIPWRWISFSIAISIIAILIYYFYRRNRRLQHVTTTFCPPPNCRQTNYVYY
jgi:hypothetical protein